ncbi:recombinase family protein [Arthrobacter sp. H16F315]|uniref:recombinase family protein n=1 Tax=Arthrobacter sp. H16F315 TaxID=2955314 RepID=UPI0021E6567F|nr:recombinase family protein [Arthrobacter sp. H16F315]MDD1476932.1 recombinase family protein [Arthrobacter sp. H16F315]
MLRFFPWSTGIGAFARVGHLLGYARVSTADQDAALQQDALKAAGCYRIFTDTASGSLESRPELTKVLDQLRPGDTLVRGRPVRAKRTWRTSTSRMVPWVRTARSFRPMASFSGCR